MGVTVTTRQAGDGVTRPRKGDRVTVHYVGTLQNGIQFDSSRERGVPFTFNVGMSQVIRGWDEGESRDVEPLATERLARRTACLETRPVSLTRTPPLLCAGILQLSLGERATLTCTADVAYGERGMPPRIPPHSTLLFDVQLLKIGGAGSGQVVTMWNQPIAAVLLVILTSVIVWGLHDSFTKHDFLGHFGFK